MAMTPIVETYVTGDGEPVRGHILFSLAVDKYHTGLDKIVKKNPPIRVNMDDAGSISVSLHPTEGDDAEWDLGEDETLTYRVEEFVNDTYGNPKPKRVYYIVVPTSVSPVKLGELARFATAPSIVGNQDLAAEWLAFQGSFDYVSRAKRALNLRDVVTPSGTNDTAAVNAALAAFDAAGGGVLRIPRDNWKFAGSTGLALLDTVNPIHIVADEDAVFDMTDVTSSVGMSLGGSEGASAALDVDADQFDDSIECGLSVSPGDIIWIKSTDLFIAASSALKGESAVVAAAIGDTITLESPLWDSYDAATTTVTKLKAPRVSVENLAIFRDSNQTGLEILYARDALLGNVYAEGARYALMRLTQVHSGVVQDCRGRDMWYSGTGTSYGLSVSSCQHIIERGNDFRGGRHAVAHGGFYVCRDIQVEGGTHDNYHASAVGCFDFHPNCENVRMSGVTMLNGLESQAANFDAVDCTVRTPSSISTLPAVVFGAWKDCDYVRFRDGDIVAGHPNANAVEYTARDGTVKTVEISGDIRAGLTSGKAVTVGAWVSAPNPPVIERLIIGRLGGNIEAGDNAIRIQPGAGDELTVEETHILGNVLAINDSAILYDNDPGTQRKLYIDPGARIESQASAGRAISANSAGDLDVAIRLAHLLGTGGGAGANYFDTGKLAILDTVIEGFGYQGGIVAGSASEAYIRGVDKVSVTGNPTLPPRHYSHIDAAGKVITHGTAAPTAGTWAVGDVCLNSNPSAGGPPGWVCTTAGTAGTWKAMANLAA